MHFHVPTKAGPFPGFPEGLGQKASARGVAALAKAPALAADRALLSQAFWPNVGT